MCTYNVLADHRTTIRLNYSLNFQYPIERLGVYIRVEHLKKPPKGVFIQNLFLYGNFVGNPHQHEPALRQKLERFVWGFTHTLEHDWNVNLQVSLGSGIK